MQFKKSFLYKAFYKIFFLHLCCIINDKKKMEEILQDLQKYISTAVLNI